MLVYYPKQLPSYAKQDAEVTVKINRPWTSWIILLSFW